MDKSEEQNTTFIKCLDYILLKNKMRFHLKSNKTIIDTFSTYSNPYEILKTLGIQYSVSNIVDTELTIVLEKNRMYVIEKIIGNNIWVWDPKSRTKNLIEKDSLNGFKVIKIHTINNQCMKVLNKRNYKVNQYKQLLKLLPYILSMVLLSMGSGILIFIVSAIIESVFDTFIPYGNIAATFEAFVLVSILIVGVYNLQKLQYYIIAKYKKREGIGEGILSLFTVFSIALVILIQNFLNKTVSSYMTYAICLIIAISYLHYLLNRYDSSVSNRKVFKLQINYVFFTNLLLSVTLLFLTISLYINNGISRGSIFSSMVLFGYVLYISRNIENIIGGIRKDIDTMNQSYYNTNIKKVVTYNNATSFNQFSIQIKGMKENTIMTMLKGTFNEIIGGKKAGKTYLTKIINGEIRSDQYVLYYDNTPIEAFAKEVIKQRTTVIDNERIKFNDSTILNYISDDLELMNVDIKNIFDKLMISDLFKKLSINLSMDENCISDTEELMLKVSKAILSNSQILIFDNVLSRFSQEVIHKIKELTKNMKLICIVLENTEIEKCEFEQVYYLDKVGYSL